MIWAVVACGAMLGMLYAYRSGRKAGEEDGALAASKQAALGLESARLRARSATQELEKVQEGRHRALELMLNLPEIVNKMGAARSTPELCRTSVRALMEIAGADRVGLFLPEGHPPRYRLEVCAGRAVPTRPVGFAVGEGRLGQLTELVGVRTDTVVATRDSTYADSLFKVDLSVAVRRHETTYAFVVMDGLSFTDAMTRRLVQLIADVHAVSAEGVGALDTERAKADMDKLTGLFNRRHLDRRLPNELERARTYGMALSVFLFDIDNFKHFNDTNGHQAGDECLRGVAKLTRQVTRSSDVVCRYGGEEFLIILLGADLKQAWQHAERVRQQIANAAFPHGQNQPLGCVSVSGGVASFPDHSDDPAALIKLADDALYQAKKSGRNRVLAPPGQTPAAQSG